jgi:hypothetical protein
VGLLVAFEGGVCPGCGAYAGFPEASVSVTQIEATAHGWRAAGKAEPAAAVCPSCGQLFTLLQHLIPVECAEYPCPACGDASHLSYRIVEVKKEGDAYAFTAQIECAKCDRRGIVRRALDQIGRITKLKISWTGVEIERALPE